MAFQAFADDRKIIVAIYRHIDRCKPVLHKIVIHSKYRKLSAVLPERIYLYHLVVHVHRLEYDIVPRFMTVHAAQRIVELLLDIETVHRYVIESIHYRVRLPEISLVILSQYPVCADKKIFVYVVAHFEAIERNVDDFAEILDEHVVSDRDVTLQFSFEDLIYRDLVMPGIPDYQRALYHIHFVDFSDSGLEQPVAPQYLRQFTPHAVKLFMHTPCSYSFKNPIRPTALGYLYISTSPKSLSIFLRAGILLFIRS